MLERTGLLVIDMQNSFCDPRGVVAGLGLGLVGIEGVVQRNVKAVALARREGLPVVFTRHCYRAGYTDATPLDRPVYRQVEAAGGLLAGSWDADVVEALGRRPEDPVIDKCRNDAFYGTALESVLRQLRVDRLLVTGVVTNVCVESTVRAAFMRDIDCTVLGDCCASLTEEDHQFSLGCLERYGFASVTTVRAAFDRVVGAAVGRMTAGAAEVEVDVDVDVVVVGAGGAGLAAAVAAHDTGASVLVVEAGSQVGGSTALSGGAIMAGGTSVQRAAGIADDSPDEFFAHYLTFNQWDVDPAIVRAFCDEAPDLVEWLLAFGVELRPEAVYRAAGERVPRSHRPTGGGAALVGALLAAARERDIDVALGTRVEALQRSDDGRVLGIVSGAQNLRAAAVVLATGGFGQNVELLARHFPDAGTGDGPPRSPAPATNVGDGLVMASAAGAATAGHNHGVAVLNAGLLPDIEPFTPGWLLFVDPAGERYVNEQAPYMVLTPLTMARGGFCWVVFDDDACRAAAPPPDSAWGAGTWVADTLLDAAADGRIESAATVAELAGRMGVPPATLEATLERYNDGCRRGVDDDFFKDPSTLKPVAAPPFYAVRMRPSIVALTGYGLRIDPDGRVLRATDHRPVPGLYAAGEVTGNVLGPQYLGGGNAVTSAVLFGRRAGRTAAGDLGR